MATCKFSPFRCVKTLLLRFPRDFSPPSSSLAGRFYKVRRDLSGEKEAGKTACWAPHPIPLSLMADDPEGCVSTLCPPDLAAGRTSLLPLGRTLPVLVSHSFSHWRQESGD